MTCHPEPHLRRISFPGERRDASLIPKGTLRPPLASDARGISQKLSVLFCVIPWQMGLPRGSRVLLICYESLKETNILNQRARQVERVFDRQSNGRLQFISLAV